MSRHHIINNQKVDFTEAEEKARDAEEKAWADEAPTRAWSDLRSERDAKLLQSDWRASGDLTISDEWKAYRKALRDLPSTLNDTTVLEAINWPKEPS